MWKPQWKICETHVKTTWKPMWKPLEKGIPWVISAPNAMARLLALVALLVLVEGKLKVLPYELELLGLGHQVAELKDVSWLHWMGIFWFLIKSFGMLFSEVFGVFGLTFGDFFLKFGNLMEVVDALNYSANATISVWGPKPCPWWNYQHIPKTSRRQQNPPPETAARTQKKKDPKGSKS